MDQSGEERHGLIRGRKASDHIGRKAMDQSWKGSHEQIRNGRHAPIQYSTTSKGKPGTGSSLASGWSLGSTDTCTCRRTLFWPRAQQVGGRPLTCQCTALPINPQRHANGCGHLQPALTPADLLEALHQTFQDSRIATCFALQHPFPAFSTVRARENV